MDKSIKEFISFLDNDNPIACYGAGKIGLEILGFLRSINKEPEMFVQTESSKYRTKLDVPIVTIDNVDCSNTYNWIITLTGDLSIEIRNKLEKKGVYRCFIISESFLDSIRLLTVKRNVELKDAYNGERCFIMATGPSLKKQNLSLLANEHVFSCSFLTLLDNYDVFKPEFYVGASIRNDYYSDDFDDVNDGEFGVELYRFQKKAVKSRIVFIDYWDLPFAQKAEFLDDHQVFCVLQQGKMECDNYGLLNIANKSSGIQTVTIMMLKIAMYLGFKKIYLIGADHDYCRGKEYNNVYDYGAMRKYGFDKLCDACLKDVHKVSHTSMRKRLECELNAFNQYHIIANMAKKSGVEIYNASYGGLLDEFDRVDFESLF